MDEFPVRELDFALPRWVTMLENGHWLQTQVYDARERARDELPQSAAGRTIMTTEPKFIPETAVPLQLEGGGECR
ncbi:hypothetical protein ACSTB0_13520, partial [Faecalibacterium wellingii]|uniref:hypothetical protein n=1 Tax=Faecalibacterium wellingii TaxID=2929491 RepID=UPI003EDABA51